MKKGTAPRRGATLITPHKHSAMWGRTYKPQTAPRRGATSPPSKTLQKLRTFPIIFVYLYFVLCQKTRLFCVVMNRDVKQANIQQQSVLRYALVADIHTRRLPPNGSVYPYFYEKEG